MPEDPIKFEPRTADAAAGDSAESPAAAVAAAQPRPAHEDAEKQPDPPFQAIFANDGVLTIRLDLKAAVVSEEKRDTLRGFILNRIDEAMVMIFQQRAKLEEQRAQLNLVATKSGKGFRPSFIDKILKR